MTRPGGTGYFDSVNKRAGNQSGGFTDFCMVMKKLLFLLILFAAAGPLSAQKVDSIYFHLYTDSLKKGQYNYINVDAKLSNGRWQPLTSKEITFQCATAEFSGNELILPDNFPHEKVTIRATLKSNPALWIERTIWIKRTPDGPLPSKEEIMRNRGRG